MDSREFKTRHAVTCSICGVGIGEACRAGIQAYDPRRVEEDLRRPLNRVHNERRAAWQELRRKQKAQ
ncbi:MAG: hypothetical protein JWQ87_5220 [Candidatus Sulfotelmatobacter sp.]|nr:hypothetical protein [Candidatus Sulfotelmatobacter sp.]